MPQKICPSCAGRGRLLIAEVESNPSNEGDGSVRQVWETCGTCGGSGTVVVPDEDDEKDDEKGDDGKGGKRS